MLNALNRFRSGGRRVDARLALRAATGVLVLALAIQAVRLTLVVLDPNGPEIAGVSVVVPGAPTPAASFDPFFRNGLADSAETSAGGEGGGVVLYGVRVGGGRSSAILAGPDGVQRAFRVGEQVAPGVTLRAVAFDHVVLARGGTTARLEFPEGASAYVPPPSASQPSPAQPSPAPTPPPLAQTPTAPAEPTS